MRPTTGGGGGERGRGGGAGSHHPGKGGEGGARWRGGGGRDHTTTTWVGGAARKGGSASDTALGNQGWHVRRAGLSLEEGLRRLREAGMEAIPGGGAEIFDEEIRARICPDKGVDGRMARRARKRPTGWASRPMPRSSTVISRGVEHRIDHLDRLRALQDRTGGFNAFIPLKYRNYGNAMSEVGEVSVIEDLRMLAMSRIYLDNIPHVKAYWVMYGKATTELALAFGADDIDGTIDDTTKIYSMAGADDRRPRMTADEMRTIVRHAGLRAVERDTLYNEL